MLNICHFMTNLNKFDSCFSDPKSPAIISVRYLLMHIFLHDYQVDGSGIMYANDHTFCEINLFELEEKYCVKISPFLKKVDPNAASTSSTKKPSCPPLVNPSNLSNVPPNLPNIFSNSTIIQTPPHIASNTTIMNLYPASITTNLVESPRFVKYKTMKLTSADDVLPFYKNVQTQVLLYILLLLPLDTINPKSGILHPDLPTDTMEVINITLGTKMRNDGVVNKSFSEAIGLLSATDSGSECLDQLLMVRQPTLLPRLLSTIDIPKYSASACLYKYANAIKNYIYIQDINSRHYTNMEVAYIYLSHIDENKYSTTCKNITMTLEKVGSSLLIKYLVPGLATTITKISTTQLWTDKNINRTTG